MTIYEYIARNNPVGAKRTIESFGYKVVNPKSMGDNLRMLVAQEGEPALKAVVDLHPDKDLILEVYGNDCGCKDKENFLGADGILQSAVLSNNQQQNDSTAKLAHQTNTLIVAVSLLVVAGLILKK
jgi:hypothetical protein